MGVHNMYSTILQVVPIHDKTLLPNLTLCNIRVLIFMFDCVAIKAFGIQVDFIENLAAPYNVSLIPVEILRLCI